MTDPNTPQEEMAQVYADPNGRQYYLDQNKPIYLDQTTIGPGEITFDPSQVVDEFGLQAQPGIMGWIAGHGQRMVYKGLTANPVAARKYIEGLPGPDGSPLYEVQPVPKSYGADLNLFVRKRGSGDPWRPIDPSPHNWKDWLNDATDLTIDGITSWLTADAYMGGAAIGGATGNPGAALIGGAAASGLASSGLESIRQAAGSAMGVPDNADPAQVRNMGVIGATLPLVGGVAASAARRYAPRAGEQIANFAATMAGVKPGAGLSAGGVLIAKARDAIAGAWGRMPTLAEAAQAIRHVLHPDVMPPFPEKIAKAQMIESLSGPAGPRGNIRAIMDGIRDIGATPPNYDPAAKQIVQPIMSAGFMPPALQQQVAAAVNPVKQQLALSLGKAPRLPAEMRSLAARVARVVQDHPEDQLPLNVQADVLETVENFARERGAYLAKKIDNHAAREVVAPVQDAVAKIRENLIKAMEPVHPDARQIFDTVEDKTREWAVLSDAYGLNLKNAAEGEQKAARTIAALYDGEDAFRRTLRDQENRFGFPAGTLTEVARRYHIGQAVNAATHGVPSTLPRMAMSGFPLGLIAGGAIGSVTGIGYAPGAAAGLVAASPKATLGLTKGALALSEMAGRSSVPLAVARGVVGATPTVVREVTQDAPPAPARRENPIRLY